MAQAGIGTGISQIVVAGTYVKSEHFQERQAQRSIRDADVMLALNRGRRFFEDDDRVYFLARRDLPREMPDNCARRAEGTVVVVGADGVLVTTYRNPRFLRQLKRRQH